MGMILFKWTDTLTCSRIHLLKLDDRGNPGVFHFTSDDIVVTQKLQK